MPPDSPVIVEGPPPGPPPAPTTEIHVTAPPADKGPAAPPPKKGSAMDGMFKELRKKAGIGDDVESATPAPVPKPKTEKPKVEAKPTETETETAPPQDKPEVQEQVGTKDGQNLTPEEKKKVSPWKLVDQYKSRVTDLEKQIAEAKTTGLAETEKKQFTDKLTAAEKRLQELEEEIEFVNFSKSKKFEQEYKKPYQEAWKRWMDDLHELTVPDAQGNERPMRADDLLQLVHMPLNKAREVANQVFGEFADDVMSARKEIKGLFEAQNRALEDARKAGSERAEAKERQEKEINETIGKHVTETWKKADQEILEDPGFGSYFKPVEGDDEGNSRLSKGFEMANKALAVFGHLRDPRLTPQQREEAVRVLAAVRNRAAAFGRVSWQYRNALQDITKLKAELAKYQSSEPGKGEGSPSQAVPQPASAKEAIFAELRRRAHPA